MIDRSTARPRRRAGHSPHGSSSLPQPAPRVFTLTAVERPRWAPRSDEERVLSDALTTGVPYVALVASRTRGTAVRDALDVPDELRAQLHTPAGLDIGARTPAEIAISILAEIVAEHHARPAGVASPASPATTTAADSVCGM